MQRKNITKKNQKNIRHKRVRAKIIGTADCPRFSVYRSNRHIFLQLIDDATGRTLLSESDLKNKKDKISKIESAKAVGKKLAKEALQKKIIGVVFDRGGYKYHGRVKAVAEGAREAGLKF